MRNLIIILTLISSISHAANTSDSTIVAEMRHVIDGKSPMTIIKSTIEIEETKYSEFSGIPDNNYRKITTCNFKKIGKGLTVVTGRQDNGRCFCIMDMNGNRDFSDDYCYYFRPERIDESETFARQPLMYDTPDGQKGGLWVAPYLAWNEETDGRDINDLHCYIEYGHQFESDINIDGKDFHINIYPIGEKYYEYNINNTSPSSLSANVPLRIGDVCFYISDINEAQQTCKIRVIQTDGINIPFAPNKDFKAPLFECKDIKGKTFSLEKQKGKYVLIDFWGTWCGPCMAALPTMRAIYEKYGKHVQLVSISTDLDSRHSVKHELPTLESVIKKHKMEWTNINGGDFINGDIIKKYMITSYPTSVLIDPDGIIVSIDTGDTGLKNVESILENIFDNDNKE